MICFRMKSRRARDASGTRARARWYEPDRRDRSVRRDGSERPGRSSRRVGATGAFVGNSPFARNRSGWLHVSGSYLTGSGGVFVPNGRLEPPVPGKTGFRKSAGACLLFAHTIISPMASEGEPDACGRFGARATPGSCGISRRICGISRRICGISRRIWSSIPRRAGTSVGATAWTS